VTVPNHFGASSNACGTRVRSWPHPEPRLLAALIRRTYFCSHHESARNCLPPGSVAVRGGGTVRRFRSVGSRGRAIWCLHPRCCEVLIDFAAGRHRFQKSGIDRRRTRYAFVIPRFLCYCHVHNGEVGLPRTAFLVDSRFVSVSEKGKPLERVGRNAEGLIPERDTAAWPPRTVLVPLGCDFREPLWPGYRRVAA
jgi:hypothetical protein